MRTTPLLFIFLGFLALGAMQASFVSPAFAAHGAKKSEGSKEEKGGGKEKGESKKKGEEDISGGRFAGDPIYVHIAPMILPIISDDGIEQLVSLVLSVRVKDLETANTLHKSMPRVTDSLLRHLYGGLDEGSLRKGKLVNVSKIKKKAAEAIGEIVEPANILDVLIEGVAQRML
jgi:flagellar protein FliL